MSDNTLALAFVVVLYVMGAIGIAGSVAFVVAALVNIVRRPSEAPREPPVDYEMTREQFKPAFTAPAGYEWRQDPFDHDWVLCKKTEPTEPPLWFWGC